MSKGKRKEKGGITFARKGDVGRVVAIKDGLVTIMWPNGKISILTEAQVKTKMRLVKRSKPE